MLRVVDDRWKWVRDHPLEVAIVILTPPFLPATLQAARAFRLLRLLRLVRAAVLTRRLLSTEGVRDAAVLAGLTVLGGGAAYAAVEKVGPNGDRLSAWDGVWWAITTVTTVGYGDSYPQTDGGRVIAIAVMLVGIGFVAIPHGCRRRTPPAIPPRGRGRTSRPGRAARRHRAAARRHRAATASLSNRRAVEPGSNRRRAPCREPIERVFDSRAG